MNGRTQTLLHLPKHQLIYSTLIVAILIKSLISSVNNSEYLPDLVSIVLLYWSINLPNKINVFSAFICGLITDLMLGSPLGQYALAYSVSTYLILLRQQQVVMFNLGMQSIIIGMLLLCNLLIISLIRLILGEAFIGWEFYLPPLIGALLWPMLDKFMLWLCYLRSHQ